MFELFQPFKGTIINLYIVNTNVKFKNVKVNFCCANFKIS